MPQLICVSWVQSEMQETASLTLIKDKTMIVEKEMSSAQLREEARRQDLVKRLTIKLIEDNQMPNTLRWSYRLLIATAWFSMGVIACHLI